MNKQVPNGSNRDYLSCDGRVRSISKIGASIRMRAPLGVDADNNNASSMVDAAWPYVATGLGSRFREMPQHTAEGLASLAAERLQWFPFVHIC